MAEFICQREGDEWSVDAADCCGGYHVTHSKLPCRRFAGFPAGAKHCAVMAVLSNLMNVSW